MFEISFRRGGTELIRHPLSESPFTVGRSPHNTIRLLDQEISRHHLRIEWRDGSFFISDLSTNGTLLNGKLVKESQINVGDSLTLGAWTVSIESQVDAAPIKTIAKSSDTKIVKFDSDQKTLTTERIEFTVRSPDQTPLVKAISSAAITIGQHGSCDVAVADPFVSRRHCKITSEGGALRISDLGSTNGTYVSGLRISETLLPTSGSFNVGRSTVSYRIVRSSEKISASGKDRLGRLIGSSRAMRETFALIERVGPSDTTVCITGESGTGKELAAHEIHGISSRSSGPFVAINCGALPSSIIESQLFGHERGAFTGAVERAPGLFEQAKAGTIFLDEIGEMPLDLQSRLLRVLEIKTVKRIGGQEEIPVNFRLICATNRDLRRLVAEGKFREDLFFRIFVVPIVLPSLRERPEDIRVFTRHFIDELSKGSRKRSLTDSAMERLLNHSWPGNVRELKNTIERTLILTDRDEIDACDLMIEDSVEDREGGHALRTNERSLIARALMECGGNLSRTSRKLGIARTTLQKKIKQYEIKNDH